MCLQCKCFKMPKPKKSRNPQENVQQYCVTGGTARDLAFFFLSFFFFTKYNVFIDKYMIKKSYKILVIATDLKYLHQNHKNTLFHIND